MESVERSLLFSQRNRRVPSHCNRGLWKMPMVSGEDLLEERVQHYQLNLHSQHQHHMVNTLLPPCSLRNRLASSYPSLNFEINSSSLEENIICMTDRAFPEVSPSSDLAQCLKVTGLWPMPEGGSSSGHIAGLV
mmetsp:Transcript_18009/g.42023  ORF Transcript_18009/g.42023 Transcript_18009/m.42023 type:complete len:134 (+) Transcript_18009:525-926(+)